MTHSMLLSETRQTDEGSASCILRGTAQRLFDTQQLVVLGNTIGAAQRTGLDLRGRSRNGEIGNGGVFGLA